MAKLVCKDYGFDCPYEIDGEVEHVIDEYRKHSDDGAWNRIFNRSINSGNFKATRFRKKIRFVSSKQIRLVILYQ